MIINISLFAALGIVLSRNGIDIINTPAEFFLVVLLVVAIEHTFKRGL